MKPTKLPRFPSNLPDDVEVRDFDLGDNKFARVIMELKRVPMGGADHLVLQAQAYEMNKEGQFRSAPLGYPSRTSSTGHSVPLSAIGLTASIDNSWLAVAKTYDPASGELPSYKDVPANGPIDSFGQEAWIESKQKVYRWTEGMADMVARTKAEELSTILQTSDVRSGFAFRNRRNKEQ